MFDTYLRASPINILEIDQSFVRAIGTEREDSAIVGAVIGLAYAQGCLFSRPRPIAEATDLIDRPTTIAVASDRSRSA